MNSLASTYECDTDKSRLDFDFIQAYLSDQSYWARGRSKARMQKAIANALCFGLYEKESGRQLGFARIATDYVVFAWLMDVFIAPEYQGQGLGKFLIQSILEHPALQEVRGIGLKKKMPTDCTNNSVLQDPMTRTFGCIERVLYSRQ